MYDPGDIFNWNSLLKEYNEPGTMYHDAACRLQRKGTELLSRSKLRDYTKVGNPCSGCWTFKRGSLLFLLSYTSMGIS